MKAAIYCGIRSIGWIVYENGKIVKSGIKRVHVDFDNFYEFMAGLPVSLRINRRVKRSARRNLWRFRSRKKNFVRLMNKNGFYADSIARSREDLLRLRVKALTHKLTNSELYAVLWSLMLKRGYKSMRGVSDNENSDYLAEIARHEENLKNFRSIADYLLTLSTSKNIIFNRGSYISEFVSIMKVQDVADELLEKIFNAIYYQRPLKKGKVAKCKFETNREVVHASSPEWQSFRILRDVNNIIIWDENKDELTITQELKAHWIKRLSEGQSITKAQCLKDMGYSKPSRFSWLSGKSIVADPVVGTFKKLGITNVNFYDLWQELYSATDTDKLKLFLKKKYDFSNYVIDELADLDLDKLGYAEFSAKAIKKLKPKLQEGNKLKQAILEVYGKVDFSQVALRNIILEKHFYSTKSLIEALKTRYQIDEIKFEIDHLFKIGNKGRKGLAKNKRMYEKWLKTESQILDGRSQYDIKKYQLWQESKGISPYEPDYVIPLKELFSDKYNIDHIVAKSTLFERGINNEVLCRKTLNEKKNKLTGADFAKTLGVYEAYSEVIEKFPTGKQEFLRMEQDTIPKDWISRRQNSDYNTKCFSTLFPNAINIPNKLINTYIKQWNVNFYSDNDARNALCRAWVLANFDQDRIHYFDNIIAQTQSPYDVKPTMEPCDFIAPAIFMPRIKLTRRTNFGHISRFALNAESVYGKRKRLVKNAKGKVEEVTYYQIKQPISKLTPNMVAKIADAGLKRLIQNRISEYGNHEAGIQSMIETPIKMAGKPVSSVSVMMSASLIYPLHSTDNKGNTGPKKKFERAVDFVFSQKNHHLLVYYKNGKLVKKIVPLLTFVDSLNQKELNEQANSVRLYERSVLKINNELYYLIGASETIAARPIYTLSATDQIKIKSADWEHLEALEINQLGEVKNICRISDMNTVAG